MTPRYNTAIRDPDRRPRQPSTFSTAQLAIGILFVVVCLVCSVVARFGVLYKDDWDWAAPLLTGVGLRDYVLLTGNEHIIAIPRLLMWLDYRFVTLPGPLTWTVGLSCYLLGAGTFVGHVLRRAALPARTARALAGVMLCLLFFSYDLQVFLLPAGITIPMVVGLSVLAMTATIAATRRLERGRSSGWPALIAVCCTAAALLSSGQALAIPFALGSIAVAARPLRAGPMVVAWLVCGVAVAWLYTRVTGAGVSSLDVPAVMLFGLAFFGGPVSYASVAAGASIGAAVLLAGLREGYGVVRQGRTSSDCQLLALGVLVFAGLTAAMTAVARARLGPSQAAQSRYALLAMLYLSAVVALWTIRMSARQGDGWQIRAAFRIALVLSAAALPIDLFVGTVWWAKGENARAAALALRVHVPDFEWIRTLHPDPARPYEWSLLAGRSRVIGLEPLGESPEPVGQVRASLPDCESEIHLEPSAAGQSFRISGKFREPIGSTLLLRDNRGAVQGVAQRAPIVAVPDPTYGQVIGAVWRVVRRRRLPDREWFGFARPGAGPPYDAIVTRAGRAVCSLSVG